MIKYNPKNWFRHITQFHRADTLRQLFPEMIIVGIYTAVLAYILNHFFGEIPKFKNTLTVHSLVGFIMGLLLVFRTNSAYDRWWEGRKLWGSLVNHSRNFALKCSAFISKTNEPALQKLKELIVAYPYVAKEHLRKGVDLDKLNLSTEVKNHISNLTHKPNGIAQQMYFELNSAYKNSVISGEQLIILDSEVRAYTDIIGACERIKNTPIPYAYSLFIKKFIFIYVCTLPFGLIPDFGYLSVPITIFVFYVMVSLELLAEEIEDPFGSDDNDLPTDELAGKIEASVTELFDKH